MTRSVVVDRRDRVFVLEHVGLRIVQVPNKTVHASSPRKLTGGANPISGNVKLLVVDWSMFISVKKSANSFARRVRNREHDVGSGGLQQ